MLRQSGTEVARFGGKRRDEVNGKRQSFHLADSR